MQFGKRSGIVRTSPRPAVPGQALRAVHGVSRRQIAGTALIGLVLGIGSVVAGTSFVQAAEHGGLFGILERMLRPAPEPSIEARNTIKRFSSLPDARRVTSTRSRLSDARTASSALRPQTRRVTTAPAVPYKTVGTQTVCVRTCDGYLFPLGRLRGERDVPVHQAACAAACPNAQTALFTLAPGSAGLEQAVSLKGQPYLASAWANVYRQKRVQNCSCQPTGIAATPLPVGQDATIRVGDVVATEDSADLVTRLVRGRVQRADYRIAQGLSRRGRLAIELKVGTMRREADEAAFRRSLRTAEAKSTRIRLAEADAVQMRDLDAGPSFGEPLPATGSDRAFLPVRVIAPSPYAP